MDFSVCATLMLHEFSTLYSADVEQHAGKMLYMMDIGYESFILILALCMQLCFSLHLR